MFCSECGAKAPGKFCSRCGHRISDPETATVVDERNSQAQEYANIEEPPTLQWESEVRYETLMRDKEVRAAVERNARRAKKGMTGEEFLALFDKVVPMGVPFEKVATIIRPLYAKWGICMRKERSEQIDAPVGKVIVRALCSLARNGQEVKAVEQATDGCIVETILPSDLLSFEGDVRLTVRRRQKKAHVAAEVKLEGQYLDWGKSRRYLDRLFDDLQREAA